MNWLLILLCGVILFTSAVKMSLMPLKVSITWTLFWGVVAYFATLLFSSMSRPEVLALLNISDISAIEFIELLIMTAYIFASGILKKILDYYPGLMISAPVCVLAYFFVGMLPGIDFNIAGAMAGCIVSICLAGLILLFRYLAVDANVLYKAVLVTALVNILIYGLL